jgi:fructose-bisphosphate aldolase class 1
VVDPNIATDPAEKSGKVAYGRGLQAAALETWRGEPGRVAAAQEQYRHRARCTGAARRGAYSAEMERELSAST